MAGLRVDAELCIGCRRCVRACGTQGIEVVDRLARPTDGCILCGACVDACPLDAISIERTEAAGADLASYHDIWVFAQVERTGALAPVARELTAKARELAAARGAAVVTLLAEGTEQAPASVAGAPAASASGGAAAAPAGADDGSTVPAAASAAAGDAPDALAHELIAYGADRVIRTCDERLAAADPELLAAWVSALARERCPEVVLFGATPLGRELAPRVAVALQTGLTADCTMLAMDPATGLLHQTRPAFGGNLMATIMCPAHRPQMATVRPGVFAAPAPDSARTGMVERVALDPAVRPRVRTLSFEPASATGSIARAKRLVVVGRGIGSKKNLPLMERLAELLGAEVGCTRPLVEAGWLDYAHQVGQTGASVAPDLLVSVGVSGAIQHLAGITGARTVVAINEDPAAPIFGAAHYQVVGDAIEVVRELVAQLEAEQVATP